MGELTGDVGVFGHDGLTLAISRSSGKGEDAGDAPEMPDSGVGGADDLLPGAVKRFFSGTSCDFSEKVQIRKHTGCFRKSAT